MGATGRRRIGDSGGVRAAVAAPATRVPPTTPPAVASHTTPLTISGRAPRGRPSTVPAPHEAQKLAPNRRAAPHLQVSRFAMGYSFLPAIRPSLSKITPSALTLPA